MYIHNGTLVSHTEKLNYDICYDYILLYTCIKFSSISFLGNNEIFREINGTGNNSIKFYSPGSERQILQVLSHMNPSF